MKKPIEEPLTQAMPQEGGAYIRDGQGILSPCAAGDLSAAPAAGDLSAAPAAGDGFENRMPELPIEAVNNEKTGCRSAPTKG